MSTQDNRPSEGVNRVQSSRVVDRDGLREACRRAYTAYDRARLNDAFDEEMVDACVKAAAPLIVKAERDRIREGIEGLRFNLRPEQLDKWMLGFNSAVDAALALLDEEARDG